MKNVAAESKKSKGSSYQFELTSIDNNHMGNDKTKHTKGHSHS